jgi:hypothetical protein
MLMVSEKLDPFGGNVVRISDRIVGVREDGIWGIWLHCFRFQTFEHQVFQGARLRILKYIDGSSLSIFQFMNYMNYCWFPYGQLLIGEFGAGPRSEGTLLQ